MATNKISNTAISGEFDSTGFIDHQFSRRSNQNEHFEQYMELQSTGTTIVGICADDAVVIGADRRASLGGRFVTSKQFEKIYQIHPTATLAITGGVGGNQQFARTLRAEAAMYHHRRDKQMSIHALSTIAGNVLSQHAFNAAPLLGGTDNSGTHLVSLDPAGGILQHEYTANGSGMQLALGVLESQYQSDLSVETAKQVAAQSIEAASERDTASGNGLTLATITSEDIEFETHDSIMEGT